LITLKCRKLGCAEPAGPGSYCWPAPAERGERSWYAVVLCVEHGSRALAKGARHLPYRPAVSKGHAVEGPGPLEADLRRVGTAWWRLVLDDSLALWVGARVSLGLPEVKPMSELDTFAPDTASEAIEAAAALGL
jgi:hypothetical protein